MLKASGGEDEEGGAVADDGLYPLEKFGMRDTAGAGAPAAAGAARLDSAERWVVAGFLLRDASRLSLFPE